MNATTTPRVWIGCLASYNAGRLIGEWVDAVDVDEMHEARDRVAVQAIAAAKEAGEWPVYFSDPEEFFLADNEGFGFNVGEYPNWEALAQVGALIEEHGEDFLAFLTFWDNTRGGDILEEADSLEEGFAESYCGAADSERDAAYEIVEDLGFGGLEAGHSFWDSELASYLDWDSIARDLFRHGPYSLVDGRIFRESY